MTPYTDPRKCAIMDCIRAYIVNNHRAPTLAEIRRATGLTFGTTQHLMKELQRDGYLSRPHQRSPLLAIVRPYGGGI